jgi:hypothetical protein
MFIEPQLAAVTKRLQAATLFAPGLPQPTTATAKAAKQRSFFKGNLRSRVRVTFGKLDLQLGDVTHVVPLQ